MSITVVGSIAYDVVKTPFGERERMLGGAAAHFALRKTFLASPDGPHSEFSCTAGEQCCSAHIEKRVSQLY